MIGEGEEVNMDPSLSQILTELFRVSQERDELIRQLAAIRQEVESIKSANPKEVTDEPGRSPRDPR